MVNKETKDVNYSSVTELSKRLQFAQKHAPKIVERWIQEDVGPKLVAEMKSRAPVDTGRLKSEIKQTNYPGGCRVGPEGVEYNRYVVEGTKPHTITPKKGKTLSFKVGNKRVYARSVKHPGTKPNPYMQDASRAATSGALARLAGLTIDLKKMKDA